MVPRTGLSPEDDSSSDVSALETGRGRGWTTSRSSIAT